MITGGGEVSLEIARIGSLLLAAAGFARDDYQIALS